MKVARAGYVCHLRSGAQSRSNPDQCVCYGNFNVLIAGAHGGVSVGPDGAMHQALEDLFAMQGLPNMSVVVPCDAVETRKATTHLLLQHKGPKYIRFRREATPVVTSDATPCVFGASERDPSVARGA
jgi:transketolase